MLDEAQDDDLIKIKRLEKNATTTMAKHPTAYSFSGS